MDGQSKRSGLMVRVLTKWEGYYKLSDVRMKSLLTSANLVVLRADYQFHLSRGKARSGRVYSLPV